MIASGQNMADMGRCFIVLWLALYHGCSAYGTRFVVLQPCFNAGWMIDVLQSNTIQSVALHAIILKSKRCLIVNCHSPCMATPERIRPFGSPPSTPNNSFPVVPAWWSAMAELRFAQVLGRAEHYHQIGIQRRNYCCFVRQTCHEKRSSADRCGPGERPLDPSDAPRPMSLVDSGYLWTKTSYDMATTRLLVSIPLSCSMRKYRRTIDRRIGRPLPMATTNHTK